MLNNYISEQEVREAIRDLNIDKSPGDDGISTEFYQAFNLAIVPILTEVFNNIWLNDEMPSSMKNGIIQLIYKKKGTVTNLKYWRPITLLNLDYKILTKILANHLKLCIDYLLNYNQSSGVKQRDILDNILNLKTILDCVKAKNLNAAFISLDNEKAFDRLEHNYMFKVLEKINFPNRYIRWINIICNDINSKVMVNGKLTEKIHIERSVRQGCPISMMLYVLCLEPLILRINGNTRIKGISIPNCPDEIKTIQHADDMTVMITTYKSYKELEKEIILFSKFSGSKINMDKTEVLQNGIFEVIPKCYVKDTIKVLGCFFGKDETQNFQNAYIKMKQIIQNWKFLKLDILERILMLKTHVISILQYSMRAFDLPKGFDKKIYALLYPYIWNSKREKLARRIINQSYDNGGLMMTDIILRNHANTLINIANIELKSKQPRAALYIYWIGITLKYDFPELAKNTWVHTIDLPKNMVDIKNTVLKYKGDKQIWKINPKHIYKYLKIKIKFYLKLKKKILC